VVCVPHASSSGEDRLCLTAADLDWVFSVCCVCVFSLCLRYSLLLYCPCFTEIFVGLLLDRSSFILRVSIIVKRCLNVILVRFVFLHRQLFFKSILLT
jgi:hypothetical protein